MLKFIEATANRRDDGCLRGKLDARLVVLGRDPTFFAWANYVPSRIILLQLRKLFM